MKAFVTGGTGFLGRHLIDALLAQGDEVTSLVRTVDRARQLPPGVRTLAGDVTRPTALRSGLRGADVVYHLAALHRLGLPPKDYDRLARTNVDATRALLTLAGELGVPRLVYVSTLAVYGDTLGRPVDENAPLPALPPRTSAYAQSKYRAHVEVALPLIAQGLPLTIVCPGSLYGPGDAGPLGRLLRRWALGRLPVALGGEAGLNFTHAADAAAGMRLAATHGAAGATYFLPGPALSLRAFLAEGERATGQPAPRLWLPGALARLLAQAFQAVRPALAEQLRAFSSPTALGAATKALSELGWQARPAAAGLPDTAAWYQAREREAVAARAVIPPANEPR